MVEETLMNFFSCEHFSINSKETIISELVIFLLLLLSSFAPNVGHMIYYDLHELHRDKRTVNLEVNPIAKVKNL